MLEEHKITQQQYDEALAFDIRGSIAKPNAKAYAIYPYLMLEAERAAAEVLVLQKYPEFTRADLRKRENAELLQNAREQLLHGGYKVYTTIDKKIYKAMKNVANNENNFSVQRDEGLGASRRDDDRSSYRGDPRHDRRPGFL